MENKSEEKSELAPDQTESAMRKSKKYWPKTKEELIEYIDGLVDRPHDYGTCVYAMSLSAVATYNYVSHKLGVSGFQASCADLDIIRRNRMMEDGFRIIDYNKLLYPQYLTSEHFPTHEQILEDCKEQLAKKASELLEKETKIVRKSIRERFFQWPFKFWIKLKIVQNPNIAPKVKERWEYIASLETLNKKGGG